MSELTKALIIAAVNSVHASRVSAKTTYFLRIMVRLPCFGGTEDTPHFP